MTIDLGAGPAFRGDRQGDAAAGVNAWSALAREYGDHGPLRRENLSRIRRWSHGSEGHVWLARTGKLSLLLKSPDLVKHVLDANESNYMKDPHSYTYLAETFASTGRRLLRIEHDGESRANLDSRIAEVIRAASARVIERTRDLAEWSSFDIDREVKAALFVFATKVLWNVDIADLADLFAHGINEFERFWVNPPQFGTQSWEEEMKRYTWSLEVRDRVIDEIIRRGRIQADAATPRSRLRIMLLETLINAHFALSSCVVFALALLNSHPDVLATVRAEVATCRASTGLNLASIRSLAVTRATVQESLRLYPPAWLLSRMAAASDTLPTGVHVPKGTRILICPYLLHRDAKHWPEPERFDPSRFYVETRSQDRFSYLPFGWGSNMCPAASQAPRYATLLLASLIDDINLNVDVASNVRPTGLITLRPDNLHSPARCPHSREM